MGMICGCCGQIFPKLRAPLHECEIKEKILSDHDLKRAGFRPCDKCGHVNRYHFNYKDKNYCDTCGFWKHPSQVKKISCPHCGQQQKEVK